MVMVFKWPTVGPLISISVCLKLSAIQILPEWYKCNSTHHAFIHGSFGYQHLHTCAFTRNNKISFLYWNLTCHGQRYLNQPLHVIGLQNYLGHFKSKCHLNVRVWLAMRCGSTSQILWHHSTRPPGLLNINPWYDDPYTGVDFADFGYTEWQSPQYTLHIIVPLYYITMVGAISFKFVCLFVCLYNWSFQVETRGRSW